MRISPWYCDQSTRYFIFRLLTDIGRAWRSRFFKIFLHLTVINEISVFDKIKWWGAGFLGGWWGTCRCVQDIKATKKVSWGKTRTQKGRGKMAAEVQSWSQQFECLNVLGFQWRLARMCGLSIHPNHFCCLPVLKTGVAKWPPNVRSLWATKVVNLS